MTGQWPVIDRSYYRWRYGIFCFWDSRFANMIQLWLKNFRNGICQTSIRTDLCLLLKRSINQRFTNSLAFGEFSMLTGHWPVIDRSTFKKSFSKCWPVIDRSTQQKLLKEKNIKIQFFFKKLFFLWIKRFFLQISIYFLWP